jgi:biotin carboxylase
LSLFDDFWHLFSMPKRLLLVAATTGYQTRTFASEARRLGVSVTLATDRCRNLDDPWQDGSVAVKFHALDWSVRRIRESGAYDGILAVGDRPALLAAHAARELGLPFHPVPAVEATRDKFLFRQHLAAAGLPVPAFFRVLASADPRQAARKAPYPCVLKPLTLSASQGVIRADNPEQFVTAFQRIMALLNRPEISIKRDPALDFIQVEEYIPGLEFAMEAVATRGKVRVLAVFDKPDPLCGPFFEETIYVTPSRSPYVSALARAFEAGAQAFGLSDGPMHGEVRWNDRGAWILEIAPRPIGGMCAKVLKFKDGSTLEAFLVRHALGEDVRGMQIQQGASGVMMIPVPQTGIFAGVEGIAQALATPGIESVEITAKLGHRMLAWPEGSSYLGFLFARTDDPESAERALRRSHACLRFQFHAVLPVAG